MRLAFVSPLPPAATGIADYAADVLALLAGRHEVEAFHDQGDVDTPRLPAGCPAFSAQLLAPRHRQRPFDVVVYQLGNSTLHAFEYPWLQRLPGLVVLHDLVLHHARARAFLDAPEVRAYAADPSSAALSQRALAPLSAYEAELREAYPRQAERLAAVQLETVGPLLLYAYPLCSGPLAAARAVGVHNDFMAAAVRDEAPGKPVVRIPMPMQRARVDPAQASALRARLGIRADEFVVGCFGLMTPEKRVESVALALGRAAAHLPGVRLLLVGPAPDRRWLDAVLERAGVAKRTLVTGRVPFEELPGYLELPDLAVHLRYPTARETSAALLRLLAQGRATVMSDLEHLADVPDDAVVRADPTDEEGAVLRAVLNLSARPAARARLGKRAAAFVAREHSASLTAAAYEQALTLARAPA
jgi:glycosyltransferase involved in cell wall biosynthesis